MQIHIALPTTLFVSCVIFLKQIYLQSKTEKNKCKVIIILNKKNADQFKNYK